MNFIKLCLKVKNNIKNTINENDIKRLLNTNPEEFVVRGKTPYLKIYEITFEFTKKNKRKQGKKIFVYYNGMIEEFVYNDFDKWIREYNYKLISNGDVAIYNVDKIDINCLGDIKLNIRDFCKGDNINEFNVEIKDI